MNVSLKEGTAAFRFLGDGANLAGQRFSDLSTKQQDIVASGILLLKVFDDAENSFKRGAANSETLSKSYLD